MQENVQSNWSNTQDVLQIALGVAQVLLEANKQLASKNIKKARKNLGQLTDVVQDNVQSSMGIAQDVLDKGTKRASKNLQKVTSNVQSRLDTAGDVLDKSTKSATKNLQKVTSNVKDMSGSVQDRIESYQRRRARKKFMFRLGLVAGVVTALLFAPWPGSETRQQLGGYWQLLSQRAQQLLNRFVG